MPACPRPGVYVPRQTHDCDAAVLVRQHLPSLLARLEESGHSRPEFVKRELEEFAGWSAKEKPPQAMTTWGGWDGSRGTCPAAAAIRVHGNPLRIFVIPVTQNVGVRLIRNKHTVSIAHFNRIQVGERMGALARIPTGPLNHG